MYYCFKGPDTGGWLKDILRKMRGQVDTLTAKEVGKSDRDAWVDYFVSQFQVECLCIYSDNTEVDLDENTVQVYNDLHKIDPSEPIYYVVPELHATCKVFYTGDDRLFDTNPNFYTGASFEVLSLERPDEDGVGYFILVYDVPQREASAEKIKEHFDSEIQKFVVEAEQVNKEVKSFNAELREQVEQAVDKRISTLGKIASIQQGLNIPLNCVKDVPMAKPITLPKKKYVLDKPSAKPEAEGSRSIKDADYEHINMVIGEYGASMERTSASFVDLDEEQLRDCLIGALSTHYKNVTGETFRNKGKTDIHIPFENRAAYIAECKIWHGPKAFLGAIKQLFSYTTWRDTKVSVIVFNKKNKNFESVLDAIQDALGEVATDLGRAAEHSRWNCKIQNEEDERVMHVSVQVFNLSV